MNTDLITWLLITNGVIWFGLTLIGILDHWLYPAMKPSLEPYSEQEIRNTKISVIIPARNEESNIERCVKAVQAQNYTNLEIIVVDDQSTDATCVLVEQLAAEDSRVRLVRGVALPKGWVGKGWALCQGRELATGEWVVLLDADTALFPHALTTALQFARKEGIDFLNPTPQFNNRGFWEKALQPLLWGFVMTRFPLMWVNHPKLSENMAFGPFLLIRSEVYDAVEGHKRVCHDILEDVALARLLKDSGYRTYVCNGRKLFEIRMYENFAQILEGWIKTAYGAMNYNIALMTAAIFGLFYLSTFPLIALVVSGVAKLVGVEAPWVESMLGSSFFAVLGLYSRRIWDHFRFGFGYISLWMHPIGMLVVQYMQFAAVWRYHFGALTWKGRSYRAGEGLLKSPGKG